MLLLLNKSLFIPRPFGHLLQNDLGIMFHDTDLFVVFSFRLKNKVFNQAPLVSSHKIMNE